MSDTTGDAVAGETMADGVGPEVETGLILPVPAMEGFVRHHRAINPAVPPEGVPAHLTLLYPFLPPDGCDVARGDVADFFARIEPFEFELSHIGWFEQRVVFLAPEDPAPFVSITERLVATWTQCIPYGGRHGGTHVPHLTLGIEGSPDQMADLAQAAEALLPVRCVADEAWLMIGHPHPARWQVVDRFPFGAEAAIQPTDEP